MSTQYKDGSWSDTENINDALKTLKLGIDSGTAARFVCGTESEVCKEKLNINLEDEIKKINQDIEMLKAKADQSMILIPTAEEIEKLSTK